MYAVTFVSSHFNGAADRQHSHEVLAIMLGALFRVDCSYLIHHPETPPLYSAGVRYRREPLGQERWEDVRQVLKQGHGDCEDLACWRAAELAVRGVPAWPAFRWRKVQTREGKPVTVYHIVVAFPDGRIEDPSRVLGMGAPGDVSPWRNASPTVGYAPQRRKAVRPYFRRAA